MTKYYRTLKRVSATRPLIEQHTPELNDYMVFYGQCYSKITKTYWENIKKIYSNEIINDLK